MKKNITCDCNIIHHDIVDNVIKNLPNENDIESVSKIFKVLGDSTRSRIVFALLEAELCVCDISSILNMTKSAISHQLSILKEYNIVKYRKSGKQVYYSLDDDHIIDIIRQTLVHVKHIHDGN